MGVRSFGHDCRSRWSRPTCRSHPDGGAAARHKRPPEAKAAALRSWIAQIASRQPAEAADSASLCAAALMALTGAGRSISMTDQATPHSPHHSADGHRRDPADRGGRRCGDVQPPAAQAFAFTDMHGRSFDGSSLAGRPMRCSSALRIAGCLPDDDAGGRGYAGRCGREGKDFSVLFVSIDPARDKRSCCGNILALSTAASLASSARIHRSASLRRAIA